MAAFALDFAGTLLATLVGAAVALIGSLWLHRRETFERYSSAVDQAIALLVEEANLYRRDLLDWRNRRIGLFGGRPLNGPPPPPDPAPSLARFSALIDGAALTAKGEDREIFSRCREVLQLVNGGDDALSGDRAVQLAEVLVTWRVLDESAAATLSELESLSEYWQHDEED